MSEETKTSSDNVLSEGVMDKLREFAKEQRERNKKGGDDGVEDEKKAETEMLKA